MQTATDDLRTDQGCLEIKRDPRDDQGCSRDTEDTVRIPISVIDDANFEIDPETVILSLKPRYTSNIPQYLLENTQARPTTATITIHDNETRPSVWIESSQDAVEGVLDGYFLLKRNTTVGSLRVDDTVSGTAANNSDYNNLNGQVTFLDGDDTVLIPISLREDTSAERTETVILTLGLRKTDNVYIYDLENTLERPSSATITITENDTVTTVNPSLPSVWVGAPETAKAAPTAISNSNRSRREPENLPFHLLFHCRRADFVAIPRERHPCFISGLAFIRMQMISIAYGGHFRAVQAFKYVGVQEE